MSAGVLEGQQVHETMMRLSTSYRLAHSGILIDGSVKLDFAKYPYLCRVLDVKSRKLTIPKGAQMGFTISMVLKKIERARIENLRGILYFFPTDDDVKEFSKSRFDPILRDNAVYRKVSRFGRDVDTAGLKKIGKTHFYFRAAGNKDTAANKSKSRLKSVPADDVVLDERDEMADDRVAAIRHRLDGSECPQETELSTPTFPDYGVDEEFKKSNQEFWFLKCHRCGHWNCLEHEWPECLAMPSSREPFYRCKHCKRELDRRQCVGEWVAAHPDVADHVGLYCSQLVSPTISPLQMANDFLKSEKSSRPGDKTEFMNQRLGRAYAEMESRLNASVIKACIGSDTRQWSDPGPCAMGADPGPKEIHYAIRKQVNAKMGQLVAYGSVPEFSDLLEIANRFHVKCGVIDQGAETRDTRSFVERYPSRFYGCLYAQTPKGVAHWDEKDQITRVGRTDTLDDVHQEFLSGEIQLPMGDPQLEKVLIPHLTNLARMKREDPRTGQVTYYWGVVGRKNDHLFHALNYAKIAQEKVETVSVQRKRERNRARAAAGKSTGRTWMSA